MYNSVTLVGRLGKDPESKALQNDSSVCNFSMVTSEKWKDKNTGEKKESAEWHNVCVFNHLATICQEYLKKGSLILITGKLKTDKSEKDGVMRYITKIVAREMRMLGGGQSQEQQASGVSQPQSNASQQFPSDNKQFDDNIPF